jgi:cysteinyl-tRNA synthetase
MEESRQALGRIDDWLARLRERAKEDDTSQPATPGERFEEGLDDDLNISAALGFLFETIRETNRALDLGSLGAGEARKWLQWWERIDRVLAVTGEESALPPEVTVLAEARMQARLAKDWRKSDELRDELAARGWEARDTKDGQKLTRRAGV